jgi:hypothetical protein
MSNEITENAALHRAATTAPCPPHVNLFPTIFERAQRMLPRLLLAPKSSRVQSGRALAAAAGNDFHGQTGMSRYGDGAGLCIPQRCTGRRAKTMPSNSPRSWPTCLPLPLQCPADHNVRGGICAAAVPPAQAAKSTLGLTALAVNVIAAIALSRHVSSNRWRECLHENFSHSAAGKTTFDRGGGVEGAGGGTGATQGAAHETGVRSQTQQHAQLTGGKVWGCMGRKKRGWRKGGGMGSEGTGAGGKMKWQGAAGVQEGADVALHRRIKIKKR